MKVKDDIKQAVIKHLQDELTVAIQNHDHLNKAFDEQYDMIHCIRTVKPNDWESDIYLPEFTSRLLTQVGNFVTQYFSSRDFVDNDINSDDPIDIAEAKASKALLNAILNDQDSFYFQKIVRLLMFVFVSGWGIIKGGYRQEIEEYVSHEEINQNYVQDSEGNFLDDQGGVFQDVLSQRPMVEEIKTPVMAQKVVKDTPVFDVWPNNAVYMSPEYTYTLNEKEYIVFESEMTKKQLEDVAEQNEYFNIDKLEDTTSDKEYREKTYGREGTAQEAPLPVSIKYKIYERWGLYPFIVKERDELNKPIDYKPGLNSKGQIMDKAELLEGIITRVMGPGTDELIGFRPSPHKRRPMVKFLCYIDPLKDVGFGDGEVAYELNTAINDTFNLSNYRTKLATTPAFKYKRFSGIEENIRITPEKGIPLENMEDLQEFIIQDNIQGAMIQIGALKGGLDYIMATSPQTMGMSPDRKETATMANEISQRANIRIGMKSMNLEFVGFTEFYRMILELVNDFMLPETLVELIGQDAYYYRPERKDKFKPVSQALETEESKQFKIRMWDQILGRVVGIPNPKTPMAVNYILGQVLELMGGDFKHFKKFMLEESPEAVAIYQLVVGGAGLGNTPNASGGGAQNQTGLPQSTQEQAVREVA